jgi:hypothetical protein
LDEDELESTIDPRKSILYSTKKKLGLPPEYDPFDDELIDYINGVFQIIHQLGVGPTKRFFINGPEETWDEFLPESDPNAHEVRFYLAQKVRLRFDPPVSSTTLNAINEQLRESEWRMIAYLDTPPFSDIEEDVEDEDGDDNG